MVCVIGKARGRRVWLVRRVIPCGDGVCYAVLCHGAMAGRKSPISGDFPCDRRTAVRTGREFRRAYNICKKHTREGSNVMLAS